MLNKRKRDFYAGDCRNKCKKHCEKYPTKEHELEHDGALALSFEEMKNG